LPVGRLGWFGSAVGPLGGGATVPASLWRIEDEEENEDEEEL